MNKLLLLITPIVLLGAGCFGAATEDSVVQESDASTVQEQQERSSYVTSNDALLFSVSDQQTVLQQDAGGVSVVRVEGVLPEAEWHDVILYRADSFDGTQVSYESWLAETELETIQGTRVIDGVRFDWRSVDTGSEGELSIYTGEIEQDGLRYFVAITQPSPETENMQAFLQSIDFFPGENEREDAEIIK